MRFRSRLLLYFLLISMFAVLVPGILQYQQGSQLIREAFGNQALQIAQLTVENIERFQLERLATSALAVESGKMDVEQATGDSLFRYIRQQLNRIRLQSGVRYIYLLTRTPDQRLVYVVDAGAGDTFDQSESLPGQVESQNYKLAHQAFDTGEPMAGEYTDDRNWGSNITAYVPVASGRNQIPLLIAVDLQGDVLKQMLAQQRNVVVWSAVVVGTIVLFLTWYIANAVSKPLHQLVQACRRIASGNWQLQAFDSRTVSAEFRELNESFRAMVGEVRYREIETRNQQLETQQVHLGQVMADLEMVKEGVQRGSRFLKHALLHDLGLMTIFAEKIESGLSADADPELLADLRVIQQKQQRLNGLIERLDLMTSEIILRPEPFEFEPWLRTLLAGKQPLLEQKQILVQLRGPEGMMVMADASHLSEVIYNLIQNAVDAMNGEVRELRIQWEGDAHGLLWLKVSDSGIGVPADQIGQIKELFFTTKQGGNHFGMGLYYCEQVMHAHQGLIVVDSEPGNGTTVTLYFPSWGEGGQLDDSDLFGGR